MFLVEPMMCVIYSQEEMDEYLQNVVISNDYPVVISKFITGAKEIEVDAVADKGVLKLWTISEHMLKMLGFIQEMLLLFYHLKILMIPLEIS